MGYRVVHGLPLLILVIAIVQHCPAKKVEEDVKLGESCDPAVDKTWYPIKDEITTFMFCSYTSKKYVKNSCPELNGYPQYFDDETRICFTPRSRMKRTAGVPKSSGIGDACFFNTDCFDNMYCLSGRCICNPGFVGLPGSTATCVRALNPGETCQDSIQCDGGWPGATCVSNVCLCPVDASAAVAGTRLNIVRTRDGTVCVGASADNQASSLCPTPEGFNIVGTTTQLAEVQTEAPADTFRQCIVGSTTTMCTMPDIYDCIPNLATALGPGSNGHCCPSRALVCIQPKKPGDAGGTGSRTRYWYNSITGLCEPFLWNGGDPGVTGSPADANGNNFRTMEHCLSYCGGTCQRGAPRLDTATDGVVTLTTRCTADSACTADTGSRIVYECKTLSNPAQCCPKRESTCSNIGGRGNAAYTPIPTTFDVGSTYVITTAPTGTTAPYITNPRWYWDSTTSRCISFTYNGRLGNFNNFLSESDCNAFCFNVCPQGQPLKNSLGTNQACGGTVVCPSTHTCRSAICCPRAQAVCIQPRLAGSCPNIVQRYYYNSNTRDCEVFDFSGCGGNDNNFADYSSCLAFCRDIRPQPRCAQGDPQKNPSTGAYLTCSGTSTGCSQNNVCEFDGSNFGCCPPRTVTCSAALQRGVACLNPAGTRFYYNPTTRICDSFTYAGCDGNSNNFVSRDECERYCGASGCPYGGQPQTDPGTSSRRICSSTAACASGYDCTSVLINNQPLNVCCLSRMTICSQNPQQGNPLGTAVVRYYFSPSTRVCTTFNYFGSGGNENNFATATQCTNFCNSAACNLGETALLDSSGLATSCNQQLANSCSSGYACRQDTLFNRFVCCGSSDMGVCPTGEKAFIEPLTLLPRECTAGITNLCPNNYLCRINRDRNRNYCCISTTGVFCPAGRAVLRDIVTRQPRTCFPSAVDQCATTGYTCQPLTTGASLAGYCCSTNPICPGSADFLLDDLSNPRTCIIQPGVNPCGATAQCLSTTTGTTNGFCCRTSGPTGDGCPAGQSVLMVSGVVQTCGGIGIPPLCPAATSTTQYTCVQNFLVTPARFQCCASTTVAPGDPDGCGLGLIAFKEPTTGGYRICTSGGLNVCPTGFGCQPTSVGQFRCCGRSEGCPANSVAQINPSSGLAQTCIIGQPCTSNAYQCQSTTIGSVCCSTGITEGTTLPPTPPPRGARCPFPNQVPYIQPGTATTLSCNPRANTCPNGYPCLNGGQGFICCQPTGSGSQCATGTVAISGGQPQTCLGLPCPANFRCTYSTTFRTYYCCSITGVVTPPPSGTACPFSTIAYFTPGSPTPARCTPGTALGGVGACPPGYSCVTSPQFQTTICCSGSAAVGVAVTNRDPGVCTAYMFAKTSTPLNCGPNPSACPRGTTCRLSATHGHQACCYN